MDPLAAVIRKSVSTEAKHSALPLGDSFILHKFLESVFSRVSGERVSSECRGIGNRARLGL